MHLELDISGVAQRRVEVKVGVTWRDPAAVVRPLEALEPGADVKWTLPCAVEAGCDGLLELTFEPVRSRAASSICSGDWWQRYGQLAERTYPTMRPSS